MIIATHNGKFHADDVFGVALLKQLFPDAQIVRSRDPEVLDAADLVLDVGGVYDVEKKRFDHHQLSSGARQSGILYSAFGLLWQEYGKEFCGNDDVWHKMDSRLVTVIDAVDNGQDLYNLNDFGTRPIDISEYLGLFNPIGEEEDFDQQFEVAVALATTVLQRMKAKYLNVIEAEQRFLDAYARTSDKRFVVLDKYIPHASIASKQPDLLYTVYPGATGNWTIQAVRPEHSQFGNRKDLPKAWRGLNGSELAEVTGVHDAVFCHKAAFIAAAETQQGALKMVELALAN